MEENKSENKELSICQLHVRRRENNGIHYKQDWEEQHGFMKGLSGLTNILYIITFKRHLVGHLNEQGIMKYGNNSGKWDVNRQA